MEITLGNLIQVKNCTIYLLTNKINNKVYVGQTWQKLKDRFSNGYGYKHSPHLYSAINKYGKENFKYTVLLICNNQDEANSMEDYYIKKFNSLERELGYNSKDGGSNGKMSQETRKKMSDLSKGRRPSKLCLEKALKSRIGVKASDETRRKQSIAKFGKPSTRIGYITSEETKMKISVANTGRAKTQEEIEKIRIANTGKKRSEEHKLKMSRAGIGRKHSLEAKKRMSDSQKGSKKSEETKKKMSDSHKGRIMTQETRGKISKSNTGKRRSKETKKKLSELNSGCNNPRYGIPRSDETKKKISDSNKGKHSIKRTTKNSIKETI